MTIGVNLNAQLVPVEMGLLTVNNYPFVSGSIIDRLLRMDRKSEDYTCVTPLVNVKNIASHSEESVFKQSILNVLKKSLNKTLKAWPLKIHRFVVEKARGLMALLPELRFIVACSNTMYRIKDKGLPFCAPVLSDVDDLRGVYNIRLALDLSTVIKNDIAFDDTGRIIILTGPNQGGKSILIEAVGVLYTMLHLGLPLPAESASICPVDGIFTHFKNPNDERGAGRFGTECKKIAEISKLLTENSLFLFDEAFSGTSGVEAIYIAEEVLAAYSVLGVRGFFVTHLHDICHSQIILDSIKQHSRIDVGSMCINLSTHQRLFTFKRGLISQKSYAMDIAKQFGLTKSSILDYNNHH